MRRVSLPLVVAGQVALAACGRGGFEAVGDGAPPGPAAVAPSNDLPFDPGGTAALALGGTVKIDSDTGEIAELGGRTLRAPGSGVIDGIAFAVVDMGGASIGVLTVDSLVVQPGADVIARGGRALALLAWDRIEIRGALDASAARDGVRTTPGPGGGEGGDAVIGWLPAGCGPGRDGITLDIDGTGGGEPGGGGGGYGGPGGKGGDAQAPTGGPGLGGIECGSATLEPLLGGSGGGRGGVSDTDVVGGDGGGGGGAVQLTAARELVITATGVVAANGAGGSTPVLRMNNLDYGGGGGGGSGGGLLLEAPRVVIAGVVAANGGGGGAAEDGTPGEDGQARGAPAAGGTSAVGDGGAGAAGTTPAADAPFGADAGGGGGGPGRIRINSQEPPALTGVVSPPPTTGAVRPGA